MKREFLPPEAPMLREIASEVEVFGTPELDELIEDMFDSMRNGGGVGLAAPQIGVSRRVIVMEFRGGERAPDTPPIPPTVLINPIIIYREGTGADWEGCLSLPGLRGLVSRATGIEYVARGRNGEQLEGWAEGFHARIIQHEIDHLDGILYTDITNRVVPYERPALGRSISAGRAQLDNC
jgi:peptide deformylase